MKKMQKTIKKRDNTWYLFSRLVHTDIQQRYQGSILGLLWSLLVPLIMLTIYTFIFSEVFSAKWNIDTNNKFDFALMLFCGLCMYNMYADVLGRSVGLIAQNQNYVKKVVFPVEILPLVITFSALFNCAVSYVVLIIANTVLTGHVHLNVLEAPLVLLPHIVFCAGISLFFSAISVYLKDISNFISVLITVGMYMSPIFFPLSGVPDRFRVIMLINPMTYSIENMRNVIIYGTGIQPDYYLISAVSALLFFVIGFWVFRRTRDGFADLL